MFGHYWAAENDLTISEIRHGSQSDLSSLQSNLWVIVHQLTLHMAQY